ncbi:hypothetical protein L486_02033 [Kwoniella mangroviensis CBS 10435]|uniref:Uncharacterized protein n=1 Tax=Kwoniella mangroviensis CBS 10435 TaxID=1331196 RepID=A0A1B9J3L1_9TREE|nr:hypothetical protein L486_02033 [Kwoniella mangroviensis CBS 10435]
MLCIEAGVDPKLRRYREKAVEDFVVVYNARKLYPQIISTLEPKEWDEREMMSFHSLVDWKLKDDVVFPDCLTIQDPRDATKIIDLPSAVKIVHLELYPKPTTHTFPGADHFSHTVNEVKGFTYALRSKLPVDIAHPPKTGRKADYSKFEPMSGHHLPHLQCAQIMPYHHLPQHYSIGSCKDGQATLKWLEVNRPSVHDVLVLIAQIGVWGMGDAIEKNMWDLLVKLDEEHKVKPGIPEAIPNMEIMIAQLERIYEAYKRGREEGGGNVARDMFDPFVAPNRRITWARRLMITQR